MSLEIQVLGPLRVLVDARPVEVGPARRRALLAALAIQPGDVVGLDLLADRVWDGRPPANPAPTVHAYVSRLRTALRTFDPDGHVNPSPLRTHSPGYVLDVPRRSLDAVRFVDDVGESRSRFTAGDALGAQRQLREALELWRGEAYADVPSEFAQREADRLTGLRLDAWELSAQVDLALGWHEAVVSGTAALVAEHPLREGLQQAYLLALYRSGRQSEALHHFGVVRELLADELGIDPGPDLRALHEAMLRQDPELEAPPTVPTAVRVERTAPIVPLTGPATSVASGQRIVGRDRELGRLRAAVARAARGRPTPVAVVGEAGIGKSRLLEEVAGLAASGGLADDSDSQGALVAWGRCWQHEGAPVLWPWLQALESLAGQLRHADRATLTRALAGAGRGVAALLPSLADLVTAGGEPGPADEGAPLRLYEAVAAFLETACADRPAVLLLEDMHWADLASRELTEYVVTRLRSARLALLIAIRSPTDESTRAGSDLLTSLVRSGRGERVDLHGLDVDAVAAYVADRTGSTLDDATSTALTERTGGNPFFVGELVRLLVTDVAEDAGELTDAVPDSVRDVVARRLDRLPEDDRTVLRVAAVVGRTFDLGLLESVCGLDEDAVDEAVDRATEHGIVCSAPDQIGRHRFVHALTQQTLLDVTGPARIRRLHGRVAAALEARGETTTPEQAERIAFHLAAAGGAAGLERAVDLSLAASDQAWIHGNFPETESLLMRALELAARIPGESAERLETSARVRLWSLYTTTYGAGAPGAVAQHDRVVDLMRVHGGSREVLTVHQARYARLIGADDLDGADRLAQEMSATADASGEPLMRAAAHLARGQVLLHRGRPQATLEQLAEVTALGPAPLLEIPAGIFPVTPRCSVLLWRAVGEALIGDSDAVATSLTQLDIMLLDVNVTTVASCETMVGFLHALRDEPRAALARARVGAGLAERHGLVETLRFARVLEAWARDRIEPGSATADLDDAVAAFDVAPNVAHRPATYGLRARLRLDGGDLDGADADLAVAERAQEATGNRLYAAPLHAMRAQLLQLRGAEADAAGTGRGSDAPAPAAAPPAMLGSWTSPRGS